MGMEEEDHQRRNIYDDLNELLDADDKDVAESSESAAKKNAQPGDKVGPMGQQEDSKKDKVTFIKNFFSKSFPFCINTD